MIEIPGRIPISIHPFFWIVAALIGWINSQTLLGVGIWMGIVFVSVLFHEFGHALTAVLFRQKARIQLVALGGLTSYDGAKLSYLKQFIIVFNGPFFGILLCLFATLILKTVPLGKTLHMVFFWTQIANLFWSVVNLLPVLPLDGGQLLRIVMEAIFGIRGFKASLLVGAILSLLLCFGSFLIQQFLLGAFFFLFGFQSFDMWRKSRHANVADRAEDHRQMMIRAEALLAQGHKTEAKNLLEEIRTKAAGGVLAAASAQYLAFLYVEEKRRDEAYDLLLSIKDDLADDARALLHQLAAEKENSALVAELSAECYQYAPTRETALRNARAFAALGQPVPAGGWIQTAWQHGGIDLPALLDEPVFQSVKNNPSFIAFLDKLK